MSIPQEDVPPGQVGNDCWHCGRHYLTTRTAGGLCGDCWPRWLHGEFILGVGREAHQADQLKRMVARLLDETDEVEGDSAAERREAQEEAIGTQH